MTVSILLIFLLVPLVGLQCEIVVFLDRIQGYPNDSLGSINSINNGTGTPYYRRDFK